jgi:hypothetical protein
MVTFRCITPRLFLSTVSRYFPQALFAILCFLNSFLCQNLVKLSTLVIYTRNISPPYWISVVLISRFPQPSRKSLVALVSSQIHLYLLVVVYFKILPELIQLLATKTYCKYSYELTRSGNKQQEKRKQF